MPVSVVSIARPATAVDEVHFLSPPYPKTLAGGPFFSRVNPSVSHQSRNQYLLDKYRTYLTRREKSLGEFCFCRLFPSHRNATPSATIPTLRIENHGACYAPRYRKAHGDTKGIPFERHHNYRESSNHVS